MTVPKHTKKDNKHSARQQPNKPDFEPAAFQTYSETDADAKWFKKHPKRIHRVRRAFPDEISTGLEANFTNGVFLATAVARPIPGLILREQAYFQGEIPETEWESKMIFKSCVAHWPDGLWEKLIDDISNIYDSLEGGHHD